MDDVTKLIYDISSKNKIISECDIDNIYENLIYKYSLDGFVKDINIDNFRINSLAFYAPLEKKIYINYKIMVYTVVNYIKKNNELFHSNDNFYLMNLYILKILLHELKHVKQEKLINADNSIETQILIKSNQCEEFYKQNKVYTKLLYDCNPIERQAELFALISTIDVSKELSNNRLIDFFKKEYLKKRIQNYNLDSVDGYPAYIYFKNFLNNNDINYFDNFYKFDINKRLELGLAIDEYEYNCLGSIDI